MNSVSSYNIIFFALIELYSQTLSLMMNPILTNFKKRMNGKIGKTSRNLKHNRLIPYGGRVMRPLYFFRMRRISGFQISVFLNDVRVFDRQFA